LTVERNVSVFYLVYAYGSNYARDQREREITVFGFGSVISGWPLVSHFFGKTFYELAVVKSFAFIARMTPSLFHPNCGMFPLDQIAHFIIWWSNWAGSLSYSAVKLFSKYSHLC